MQSKYKVGLMRLNLLAAALLLALLASRAELASSVLLLCLAAVWLSVTAACLEFSHRRPAMLPWQLLPSLLLAGLLWLEPANHALWIWFWPVLMMLPQPRWMLAVNLLLAALTWWSLRQLLGFEQALLSGLVLATLMLTGLARHRHLLLRRQGADRRVRLVPGLPLWSANQLASDLHRERARCRREGVHGELMLLNTPRRLLWTTANALCRQTLRFENCYRLDHRTLAALLLSRDEEQARQRRQALLETLQAPVKARFIPLEDIDSLDEPLRRFERQASALAIDTREVEHG